jgi:ribosomal protein S18 acetylase RimI-like enzyme
MTSTDLDIRRAQPDDAKPVLAMCDEVIAWMVEHNLDSQWGDHPWSKHPLWIIAVEMWCSEDRTWIAAQSTGEILGILVFASSAPSYARPAMVSELFISMLITSRSPNAKGIGRRLLAHADVVAQEKGVEQVRFECFAGNDGALIRYYESAGYQKMEAFDNEGWPGQVLVRPVERMSSD